MIIHDCLPYYHKKEDHIRQQQMKVFENYTPIREYSAILREMDSKDLTPPPMPQKNGAPMGTNVDQYCRYHQNKCHHTNICNTLNMDIKVFI